MAILKFISGVILLKKWRFTLFVDSYLSTEQLPLGVNMPLKQNLLYNFLLSVSQVLFPLITIPYVSRILAPETIGRVGFIDSYTYFFTVLAEFGIITYGVREISKKKGLGEKTDQLVSELLVIQFVSGWVVFLPFLVSIFYLKDTFTEPALLVWALAFYVSNLLYAEWFFWGTEQFRFVAIRSFLVRLIATIAVFLLVKKGDDYTRYYAIMASAGILNLMINFIQLTRTVKLQFKALNLWQHFKPLLVIHGITLCYSSFSMLDTPLLRFSSHSEFQTGIYVFSIKIIRTTTALITDFLLVLFPFTVGVQQSDLSLWKTKIRESATLILMFSIPMTVGLYLVAPTLTRLYFGQHFSEVSIGLQWLSVLVFIVSFELFLNKQVLLANHLETATLKIAGVCSFLFLLGAWFLGNRWGYKGAAMALISAEMLLMAGYLLLQRSLVPGLQMVLGSDLGKILIGTSGMASLVFLFPDGENWSWSILILYILLSMVIYFSLVLFVFRISLRKYFQTLLFEKLNR